MASDERRPLLPIVDLPCGHLPDPHKKESEFERFASLPLLAWKAHKFGILLTVVSATVCWWLGYAEKSVIDDLVFKSIFIIFGFTMGFRNVRANQRYSDALQHAQSFYSAFWGIYTVMPTESRLRIRAQLLAAMQDSVSHIHRVGKNRQHCWFGIVGLEPAAVPALEGAEFPSPGGDLEASKRAPAAKAFSYGSTAMLRSLSATWEEHPSGSSGAWVHPKTPMPPKSEEGDDSCKDAINPTTSGVLRNVRAVISPHVKLSQALMVVEEELERIESGSGQQKLRRNFWLLKAQVLKSYDSLLSLSFPSVTDRFLTFVDMCLFFFAVSFPWGIKVQTLELDALGRGWYKVHIDAGVILVFYTTVVVMVLFTLNALTAVNEDPLAGLCDDVDLRRLARAVAYGFEAFDSLDRQPTGVLATPAGEEAAVVEKPAAGFHMPEDSSA
mmetsp:Transcript_105697/g.268558  ORF Transcript_105697/g.268558 Transcript_105697/m.268558 type:complete len:441 (+) Transcript_105697:150-1472(+)